MFVWRKGLVGVLAQFCCYDPFLQGVLVSIAAGIASLWLPSGISSVWFVNGLGYP